MQTLVELAHLQYDYIELYLPQIAQITTQVVNNDDSSVGLQGIEFWTTLTEKETAREKRADPQAPTKNYIRNNAESLITLVLQNILKVQGEDDEDDEDETGVQ